jgi:hypothetical protein
LGEIGKGGFAKVCLVERKSDNLCKELKRKDNNFANELKNEEVSKVVKIYDVDNRCIIMELCDN